MIATAHLLSHLIIQQAIAIEQIIPELFTFIHPFLTSLSLRS
jgi:hypothetical protein